MMQPNNSRHLFFYLTLLAMACCGLLPSQAWQPSLYPADWTPPDQASFTNDKLIQDFSYAGYRRGEESLPQITGPIFDVTAPPYNADPTGTNDSTSAIQAAIDTATVANGGVVFLPAGTYLVEPQHNNNFALWIQHSNVVLRGAGVGQTFILNTSFQMHTKEVIRVAPQPGVNFGPAVAITTDLDTPTRRIPVAALSDFQVGDIVRLEWAFTQGWIDEHNQGDWWSEDNAPNRATYHREITAVNFAESWIEVDIPTRYTMRTRDDARVRKVSGQLSGIGLEDFSIGNVQHPGNEWEENDFATEGNSAWDANNSRLINVSQTFDSWLNNVHSYRAPSNTLNCHMLSNGLRLIRCFRITVANCEMRRSQYGGGGGNGYMFRIQDSNENLIMDSIADFSRHGFVVSHAGSSGNVFLRCEDRNTKRSIGSTQFGYTTNGEGSDHHQHFSHSNLFDMCHAYNSYYTAHHRDSFGGSTPHALTSAHGVYWNTSGSGFRGDALVRSEQARYGYVIGTSGTRSDVTTPTGGGTAPTDHVEGVGIGANMQPQSLYLDQLARRAQGIVVFVSENAFISPTENFPLNATAYTYGNRTISYQWSQLSGPSASIADPTSPTTSVSLLENGAYVFAITAEDGELSNHTQVTITVAPPRPDGVASWPFEEGSSTTTSATTGTTSDTFGTGVDWSSDTAGIGSTASLSFPNTATGFLGTNLNAQALGINGAGAKTITAWIKTTASSYNMFFGWSPGGGGGPGENLRLGLDTDGRLRFEVSNGFARYDPLALNDGNWHMVGVIIEAGDRVNNVKFYINGAIVNPTSTGGANPSINTRATGTPPLEQIFLGIGFPGGGSNSWGGLLDDVRVFDSALDLATLDGVRAEMFNPASLIWGGAGSEAAPVFWNETNNNKLPTHWARPSPPNMAAGNHATLQAGGIQRNNGLAFDNGASMTLNFGAYFRLNTTNSNPITLFNGSSLLINQGTFQANTQFLTLSASSLEVVNGSFIYNHQAGAGFGMNNGATVTIRSGGLVEASNFFNTNNQSTGAGSTIVIDGGTLRAAGPEADPLRATNGLGGGGFDFTHPSATIELSNFTGENLTTYLQGRASSGFFKIDGTTVSGFGPSHAINHRYLKLSDNGTSGALTLTSLETSDYALWTADFPGADLSDPSADFDGDGLTNQEERIWGLDPTNGASVSPFSSPFDPATRQFTYTRRLQSLTGINYTYQWSDGLSSWNEFIPASESASGENPVETVTVEVPPAILGSRFFLRVIATEN